jgi:hypothetical protein
MLTDLDLPAGTVIAIQMPIFNPEAPRTLRHSYLTSEEVSCSAELNADESLYCEVDTVRGVDNSTLIIRDAITSTLSKGSTIQVRVNSIYNPLSSAAVYFTASFANLSPRDGALYPIETGTVSWKALRPAVIDEVQVTAVTYVVQEYTDYTFQFTQNVEVESGAFVQVEFPTSDDGKTGAFTEAFYQFDTNLNLMTTLGGIFGGKTDNAGFEVDSINLVIETTQGTPSWSPETVSTMTIMKVRNPRYEDTFGPFRIKILDKQG